MNEILNNPDAKDITLESSFEVFFDLINSLVFEQENKSNDKQKKFIDEAGKLDALNLRVGIIGFCLQHLVIKCEEANEERSKLFRYIILQLIENFEIKNLEYNNLKKRISEKSGNFYSSIHTSLFIVRRELFDAFLRISGAQDREIISLDPELINFSDSLQNYLKAKTGPLGKEYYAIQRQVFEEAYKMRHYAEFVQELDFIKDKYPAVAGIDLLQVHCARLQDLCLYPHFARAKTFVVELCEFKIGDTYLVYFNSLKSKASFKIELLEYILAADKRDKSPFLFNEGLKLECYYLVHRLYKSPWFHNNFADAIDLDKRFYIKGGEKNQRIKYEAIVKLLGNHKIKNLKEIDVLFRDLDI